ncbi:MAG: patatin-like phospholipase family protein [Bacteroidota bacterium]
MNTERFKILSIDGGGIKGIVPCIILKAIETETHAPISELFNLIAGTSTGGIIALGLTKPDPKKGYAFTADDMLQLYVQHGKDIFAKRHQDLLSRIGSLFSITEDVVTHNYDVTGFETLLKGKFGETRIKDAIIPLLITTYDVASGKPYYYSSRLAELAEEENTSMFQVARSTSAAPTFFEPYLVKNNQDQKMAFVDGGVFANNPSVLAYAEAKELWKKDKRLDVPGLVKKDAKGHYAIVTPDDKDLPFYMLSLGCGGGPSLVDYSDAQNWRAASWIKPLLTDVFMRSVEESVHYIMQYLMPPFENGIPRYDRLNPLLPPDNRNMDDASDKNIEDLVAIAEEFVSKNKEQIKRISDTVYK